MLLAIQWVLNQLRNPLVVVGTMILLFFAGFALSECRPHPAPDATKPVVTINNPITGVPKPVVTGAVTTGGGKLVVTGNEKPLTVTLPKPVITVDPVRSGHTNVVVTPVPGPSDQPQIVVIPPGGGMITLPDQTFKIDVVEDRSPLHANFYIVPKPAVGVGYKAITIDLQKSLNTKANLGEISFGPLAATSVTDGNLYVGIETTRDLGKNVNVNLGYGYNINQNKLEAMAGVGINF